MWGVDPHPAAECPSMARKKSEKSEMPATAEKTKPVRLDLSAETHRRLRVVAAEEGKSMSVFAREAIEQLVNERYEARRR
jgi:predicted HicB family RNase H-like nuclease